MDSVLDKVSCNDDQIRDLLEEVLGTYSTDVTSYVKPLFLSVIRLMVSPLT